jgi:hypothetical protein
MHVIANQGDQIGLEVIGQSNRLMHKIEIDERAEMNVGHHGERISDKSSGKIGDGDRLAINSDLCCFPEPVTAKDSTHAEKTTAQLCGSS